MLLEQIDFSSLTDKTKAHRWGAGDPLLDRHIYSDGKFWYKIWDRRYTANLRAVRGNTYDLLSSANNSLHGFDVGFYDNECASAFCEFIHDHEGVLRGYITKHGDPLSKAAADSFLLRTFAKCLETGWVPTDVCHNNLVLIDDRISFIDYDSHFTSLADLDRDFELAEGSLRSHVYSLFRGLVYSYSFLLEKMRQQTMSPAELDAVYRQHAATVNLDAANARNAELAKELKAAKNEIVIVKRDVQKMQADLEAANVHNINVAEELRLVKSSLSWRITKLLRAFQKK